MVCCISGPVLLTEVRNPNLTANWVGDHWGYNWVGSRNVNVPPIALDADANCTCLLAWTRSATLSVWWQLRNPNLEAATHTVQWVGGCDCNCL